jgi:SsrA-binding protein
LRSSRAPSGCDASSTSNPMSAEGEKTVASNRKARHDYSILERFECGIVLTGSEIKSIRSGKASLQESFARIRGDEMWLEGMHVPPYEQGDKRQYEAARPRKLLLHRRQIQRIEQQVKEQRLALVPLRVYLTHGLAKVEVALARGKRTHEKRQAIAEREAEREMRRSAGRRR